MLSYKELEKFRARLKHHGTVEEYQTEIGKNIKTARKKTKLSQEDVALLLEVDAVTIRRHETGKNMCSLGQLINYCRLYECKMDDLLPKEMIPYLSTMNGMEPVVLQELQLAIEKTLTKIA